jgi:hypothetical protein
LISLYFILFLSEANLVLGYWSERNVDSFVLWVAVLLQSHPEVVTIIDAGSLCHRIFDQFDPVAKVDLLVPVPGRGVFDFDGIQKDSQLQLVGDVLVEVEEAHTAGLLDRPHGIDLELPGIRRKDLTLTRRMPDVDLIGRWG